MKALDLAASKFLELEKVLKKSGIIDSAILDKMSIIRKLLRRASNGGIEERSDEKLLTELLGPDMGNVKK